MEFEFGNFGEGLIFQEKFGELFALNRSAIGIEDRSIQKTKSLDSVALDELQAEIQGKLMEKREEFKILTKKLDLKVSRGPSKEIQRIMSLDSVALDELQAEIQGKLMEKREEFKRVSHRLNQISTTPRYIR